MSTQDYLELAAAGYLVTRRVQRPDFCDASLVPEQFLTASECFADMFPSFWALSWNSISESERLTAAAKFGIGPETLPRLVEHTTRALERDEFGWSHFWFSPQAACSAVKEFVPAYSGLVLLGLGLPRDLVDSFLTEVGADDQSGICQMLRLEKSLAQGGTPLGWEALGCDLGGTLHSWLCNGLEKDASEKLGIRPAANGLLANEADARAVVELAVREHAEPVPWRPFLLVEYKIE